MSLLVMCYCLYYGVMVLNLFAKKIMLIISILFEQTTVFKIRYNISTKSLQDICVDTVRKTFIFRNRSPLDVVFLLLLLLIQYL